MSCEGPFKKLFLFTIIVTSLAQAPRLTNADTIYDQEVVLTPEKPLNLSTKKEILEYYEKERLRRYREEQEADADYAEDNSNANMVVPPVVAPIAPPQTVYESYDGQFTQMTEKRPKNMETSRREPVTIVQPSTEPSVRINFVTAPSSHLKKILRYESKYKDLSWRPSLNRQPNHGDTVPAGKTDSLGKEKDLQAYKSQEMNILTDLRRDVQQLVIEMKTVKRVIHSFLLKTYEASRKYRNQRPEDDGLIRATPLEPAVEDISQKLPRPPKLGARHYANHFYLMRNPSGN